MTRTSVVAAALAAFLAAAVPASAAPIHVGESQTWIYSGATVGCITCSATVTFELLTGTRLRLEFENTSTDGEAGKKILTGIGFDTNPNLTTISVHSQSIEGGRTWSLGGGIGAGHWEIGLKSNQGINNGLDNQSDLADSGWMILTWSSPIVGALGLNIDATVTKFQAADQRDLSLQAPGTPVPEPGTLMLLGAGAFLAARRRYRA